MNWQTIGDIFAAIGLIAFLFAAFQIIDIILFGKRKPKKRERRVGDSITSDAGVEIGRVYSTWDRLPISSKAAPGQDDGHAKANPQDIDPGRSQDELNRVLGCSQELNTGQRLPISPHAELVSKGLRDQAKRNFDLTDSGRVQEEFLRRHPPFDNQPMSDAPQIGVLHNDSSEEQLVLLVKEAFLEAWCLQSCDEDKYPGLGEWERSECRKELEQIIRGGTS